MKDAHLFCGYCGTLYSVWTRDPRNKNAWPRRCDHCGEDTYCPPVPAINVLVPVLRTPKFATRDNAPGLLVIQRGIEPGKHEWAFPGGYFDHRELWEEAAVRELEEETGLVIPKTDLELIDVTGSQDRSMTIMFALAQPIPESQVADQFQTSSEVLGAKVINEPIDAAFESHTFHIKKFFEGR